MPFKQINIIKIEDINKRRYGQKKQSKSYRKDSKSRITSEFSNYSGINRRSIGAPVVKKIESTPIKKNLPVFSTYDKIKYDENLNYIDLSQMK